MIQVVELAANTMLALSAENISIIAYIDPGSGSIIIQLVLATILGVGAAFRFFRRSFTDLFTRIFRSQPVDVEPGSSDSSDD